MATIVTAAINLTATIASAAVYQVSGQGNLTGGHMAGFVFEPQQFPPSQNVASLSGAISAELDLQTNRVRFSSGEGVVVNSRPTVAFEPAAGGAAGAAPGNFGVNLVVPVGSGEAAIRDLAFTITGESPIRTGGVFAFDTDPLALTITSGTVDYSYRSNVFPGASGSKSLVGLPVEVSGSATIGKVDRFGPLAPSNLRFDFLPTLRIPLSLVADNDTALTLNFSITAAAVPEPVALGLLLPAGAMLLRRRRK